MDSLRKLRNSITHHDHSKPHDAVSLDADGNALPEITDNIAFNAGAREPESSPVSKTERVKEKLQSVRHAVAHPHQAAKQRGQKELLKTAVQLERPWLGGDQKAADAELFGAYDELEEQRRHDSHHYDDAAGHREADGSVGKTPLKDAEARVEVVEAKRTELEVVWHLSRYVRRARVVRRPLAWPPVERYREVGADGDVERFLWLKWAGHIMLYGLQASSLQYIDPTNTLPYDRMELTSAVERLLVVSQAYQAWWSRVRHVYRWEDPWLTFKWFLVYLVMVKTGYFMTCFWAYLCYSFGTNRYGKHSRYWMRESDARATKTKETAATISELIIRHGPDAWLEPFLEQFGPWLQVQVLDLAQFLEICNASYSWRDVTSTSYTWFGYFVLMLVSAIPDMQFSIRLFWMSCGMYFFASRPIASLYPRFRHVIDPLRWFYWNTPTMSEHCFRWLREHALLSLDRHQKHAADLGEFAAVLDNDDDEEDAQLYFESISTPPPRYYSIVAEQQALMASSPAILSFKTHWSGRRGRLEVTRKSVRFVLSGRGNKSTTQWERTLADLLEVRKLSLPLTDLPLPSLSKLSKSSAALSILWVRADDETLASTEEHENDETNCEEEVVYGMVSERRDEAFNALIGVSGAMWMELQAEAAWQTRSTRGPKSN
ncbi:hypothetical protein LTR91_002090 [Friedmanniomyces endolithicus]|uniref:Uncharacterized protein n=1 Tax=Friedmanniomyces endolithicus TaxID=329885 RepID=A0AAN6KYT5_9PEZI|nr:hypothetical protein LTS00_003069 [Friedmanniomyces endolithicus]KAK1011619.1 hypothetical protein LTR91_002090 [Friedmanniomyces endolithicus]KAK1015717.1 hypothetical protein LTR54_003445 [Friedmanniomyces endolithicus]